LGLGLRDYQLDLQAIVGWADLEHLMLQGCLISNQSLESISRFFRLVTLDIGNTRITTDGIAASAFPSSLQSLGLAGIRLCDRAVDVIAALPKLLALNCNGCELSPSALSRLTAVPTLHNLEAIGSRIAPEVAVELTRTRPRLLLRLDSGLWKSGVIVRPVGGCA